MTSRLATFITPGASLQSAVDRVQLAEKLGYDAVFSTQIGARDGLMTLAAYANATSKIKLGTGVIPAFPRHPVALAYEAATLDEISGGRSLLGVGTSHVRKGEKEAGRPEGSCEIVAAIPSALAEDVEGARNAFRREFFTYMTLPFYRKAIAGAGYQAELDNFDAALGKGDMPNAFQAISEPLIEEFAAIGDEKAIHSKIDEYRDAGVSIPAVGLFSGPKGSGLDPNATLEAAIG